MDEAKMPDGTVVIIPDPNDKGGNDCTYNFHKGKTTCIPYIATSPRAYIWAMFAGQIMNALVSGSFMVVAQGGEIANKKDAPELSGKLADELLAEYDKRWSESE